VADKLTQGQCRFFDGNCYSSLNRVVHPEQNIGRISRMILAGRIRFLKHNQLLKASEEECTLLHTC